MSGEQKVEKLLTTRQFLDKQRNPWEYVEEELPTTTVKLKGAARRASARAPRGTAAEGSYRIVGSHYDKSLGTYSLRITRLSLAVMGSTNFQGTVYQFHIRHSREGTLDVIPFGEQGRVREYGDPRRPLYAVGPGTLLYGWDTFKGEFGTQLTVAATMEGVVG